MTSVLDPQAQALLDKAAASGKPELYRLGVDAARALYLELAAAVAVEPVAVGEITNRTIAGPGRDLPLRLYRPESAAKALPVLIYFHGGGWVVGNLDSHDEVCRWLCARSGALVAAVDYRMGPEHKFPFAVEDAFAATRWVAAHAAEIGADAGRLAVGGDSAGGNLAAVVTHLARDGGGPEIAFQLLVYPATDLTMQRPSHQRFAEGYRLTRPLMDWFVGHYLRDPRDRTDPRGSPLLAGNFSDLPPALVITAGFDPLRDEGQAYAAKLDAAGGAVEHVCYDGMIHGFFHMGGWLDKSREALDKAGAALAAALKTP